MRRLTTLFCLTLLLFAAPGKAAITTIALSTDNVPGLAGAKFGSNWTASINGTGSVAFISLMSQGVGGITSVNDSGLFVFDGSSISMLAQEGSGNVPSAAGASFDQFYNASIDHSGNVVARASLQNAVGGVTTSNGQGFWLFGDAVDSLIARSGSGNVPGVTGGNFENFPILVLPFSADRLAIECIVGGGTVNSSTNSGIWKYIDSVGSLVAREGVTTVPGVPGALFNSFGNPAINDNSQVAFLAALKTVAGVTDSNRHGIWKFDGNAGQLLARTGVGNVPGFPGANFSGLNDALMNPAGQVAFRGQLTSNQVGVWKYTEAGGFNLALTGLASVPGIPDATFSDIRPSFLTEGGSLVATANLNIGPGGVTSENDLGLWLFDDLGGQLLLRVGAGNVPEIPGANFDDFLFFARTSDSLLVEAALDVGPGGVTSSNDGGIWRVPFDGQAELVLREGDNLFGRTIEYVGLPSLEGANIALQGVSNDEGQFIFRADFTNGESGLFLYSPESDAFAAADFNTDGYVNDVDLQMWQAAYGASNAGDADDDGDTDGRDFLLWQRQYTGSPPSQALTVPEPGVSLMIFLACGMTRVGLRGSKPYLN